MARYTLHVPNGDYGYREDSGQYGVKDFNYKTDSLASALHEFLDHVSAYEADEKDGAEHGTTVTLTFRVKAKKVKK